MRRYFVEYKKCEKGGCKKGRGGGGIIQLQMERGLVYSIPYFLCK